MMTAELLTAEEEAYRKGGSLMLADVYFQLQREWDGGNRDRELGLHLLFLSWYGLIEPDFITGFDGTNTVLERLRLSFIEVYSDMGTRLRNDPEFLYVVGLMAHLSPWLLGSPQEWESKAEELQKQYRALSPQGLDPSVFENRGAYGLYFGRQATVPGGY